MICWICNQEEATTGEHIIKASDIAMLYPDLSTDRPVFLRKEGERTRSVFGKRNANLKFEKSLCARCNNELTQPHDLARDRFIRALLEATKASKFGSIRASTLFPADPQRGLLDTHLFFAKLFGCTVIAEEVQFDTSAVAKCIREGTAVPDLWIAVTNYARGERGLGAARGPIRALTRGETIVAMHLTYYVDTVALFLSLSLPTVPALVPRRAWNPGRRDVPSVRFAPVSDLPHRTKVMQGSAAI